MNKLVTKRKWFVLFSTAFMMIAGIALSSHMPMGVYPASGNSIVSADFSYDLSAQEFYQNWGIQIEDSLRGIKNVHYVEAKYRQNSAAFTVHFEWGVDADEAKREVAAISQFYQSQLPNHYPDVFIYHSAPGTETYVAISSDVYSADTLSKLATKSFIPRAESIQGVDRVWVSSPGDNYMHIMLNPFLLSNYKLSLDSVIDSLKRLQYPLNLGKITTASAGETSLYFETDIRTVEQIENLVILVHKGKTIRLKDIAIVKQDYKIGVRHFAVDDKNVIAVAMWPSVGANLYEVADEFVASVRDFIGESGEVIIVNHPKEFIKEAILNVLYSIVVGIFSALILVFLAYRRLSTTLLIVIAIPATLSISLMVMYIIGIGINLLSLGAMAIVVGTVVDSSVVMVEYLDKNKTFSIDDALEQIKPSIIASTMTSCIVFFPLLLTSPLVKSLLFELVISSIILMLVSLYISIFVVPKLFILFNSKYFSQQETVMNQEERAGIVFKCIKGYVAIIPKSKWIIGLILLVLITANATLAYYIFPNIRQEVVAPPRAEIIDVELTFDNESLTLVEKQKIIAPYQRQIEELLGKNIELIYQDIRQDSAYLSVYLTSYQSFEFSYATLKSNLKNSSGTNVDMAPWVTASLEIASRPDATIYINHANSKEIRDILLHVTEVSENTVGVLRVKMTPSIMKSKVIFLRPKKQLVNLLDDGSFYHISKASMAKMIQYGAEPKPLFIINNNENDLQTLKLSIDNQIVKQWALSEHQNNHSVDQLPIMDHLPIHIQGRDLLLGDVFQFDEQVTWREFYSKNRQKTYKVDIWLDGSERLQDIKSVIHKQLEQDGIVAKGNKQTNLSYIDLRKTVEEDVNALLFASLIATVLTFLFMLYHFSYIRYALMAMSVAAFGVVGALLALYLFESTLSLNSILGMLVLVGLAVNNAILLIDFYSIYKSRQVNNRLAICFSIDSRLKTLLVTSATTLVAMIPINIGYGAGQDIIKPLGLAVSAGLLYSTIASLLFLPILLAYEGD